MNNSRTLITMGAIGIVLVLSLIYRFKSSMSGKVTSSNVAYYSADDGATFFTASFTTPPFHAPDGREAFAAQVFSADDGATKFVGYLIRAHPQDTAASGMAPYASGGSAEVKKPGPGNPWITAPPPNTPPDDPQEVAYQAVIHPQSPAGSGHPVPLIPEQ